MITTKSALTPLLEITASVSWVATWKRGSGWRSATTCNRTLSTCTPMARATIHCAGLRGSASAAAATT